MLKIDSTGEIVRVQPEVEIWCVLLIIGGETRRLSLHEA